MTFIVKLPNAHGWNGETFTVETDNVDSTDVKSVRCADNLHIFLMKDDERRYLMKYIHADIEDQVSEARDKAYMTGGVLLSDMTLENLMKKYGRPA